MYNQPPNQPFGYHFPMASPGIHGNLLEVTVVSCNKLKDTEWISRQDPYVCVEYGSNRSRTRTCTDGGKNPTFQEKFVYTLIEGLRELNVVVWNSNSLKRDDFIGSGKVQLAKALSQGFDDSTWPLQSKTGRHAGEVRFIIHYSNANKPTNSHAPPAAPYGAPSTPAAAPYGTPSAPQTSLYSAPQPAPAAPYPQAGAYPAPSPYSSYPPNSGGYPPSTYAPNSGPYPPSTYPPQAAPYPPQYPPNSAYPSQPYGSSYPPGPPRPGMYPPPY